MSILDTLITARTSADVARIKSLLARPVAELTAAEIAEIIGAPPGLYGPTDLNRVGAAQLYISARLSDVGADNVDVLGRQNWTAQDIPRRSDLNRYLADTTSLRDALGSDAALPASMRRITYQDANNIEKCLLALDEIVDRIKTVYFPSGSTFAVSGAPHLRIGVSEYV